MELRRRRQKHILHPFRGVDEAEHALAGSNLQVRDYTLEPDGPPLRDSISVLCLGSVTLSPGIDPTAAQTVADSAGVPVDALGLVVTGRVSFLKWEDVLLTELLADLRDTYELSAAPRPRVLRANRTGYDLLLSIVLMRELPRTRLQAWRQWSVLASTQFKVRPTADVGFQPQRLTPDLRKAFKLPPGASRYIDFQGDSVWEATSVDELVTVYVDESLLQLMGGESSTRKQLQAELAGAVYSAIFTRCATQIDDLPDDPATYAEIVIAELCQRVEKATKSPPGTVIDQLQKGKTTYVDALVEGMVDLQGSFLHILKGSGPSGL